MFDIVWFSRRYYKWGWHRWGSSCRPRWLKACFYGNDSIFCRVLERLIHVIDICGGCPGTHLGIWRNHLGSSCRPWSIISMMFWCFKWAACFKGAFWCRRTRSSNSKVPLNFLCRRRGCTFRRQPRKIKKIDWFAGRSRYRAELISDAPLPSCEWLEKPRQWEFALELGPWIPAWLTKNIIKQVE